MVEPAFTPFPPGEIPGYIIIIVVAFVSTFALLSVAIRWAWVHTKPSFTFNDALASSLEHSLYRTQLGIYAACLLAGDAFISLAGLLSLSWLADKGIQEGVTCNVQAAMMQIGNIAAAYFTTAISIHTYNSLVLLRRQSTLFCVIVTAAGWFTAIVLATVPLVTKQSLGPVYGLTGLSCCIRTVYPLQQFFIHLVPIFLAGIISVVLYSLVFLVLRGTLTLKGGIKLVLDPHQRRNGHHEERHRFVSAVFRRTLWYPFVYVVLVLPYSFTRLADASGSQVSFGANVFAALCWFSQGLVNVLVFYNTFRVLWPALDVKSTFLQDSEPTNSVASENSFFTPSPLQTTSPKPLPSLPISTLARDTSYYFPIKPSPARERTHYESPSGISSDSPTRRLLPSPHQATSGGSFGSMMNDKLAQITANPISELNQAVVFGPPAGHMRSESKGLPPTPLPTTTPSPDNNEQSMVNAGAIPPSRTPLSPTVTGHVPILSIINMYSGPNEHVKFADGTHPPLPHNSRQNGTTAQVSRADPRIIPNFSKGRTLAVMRPPSVPSSVTNSTSSLSWAPVLSSEWF